MRRSVVARAWVGMILALLGTGSTLAAEPLPPGWKVCSVGDQEIVLPPPEGDFVLVGPECREWVRSSLAGGDRILAVWVPPDFRCELSPGEETKDPERAAQVFADRDFEDVRMRPAVFQAMVNGIESLFAALYDDDDPASSADERKAIFGADADKGEYLGVFFRDERALAMGLTAELEEDGEPVKVMGGFGFLLVRGKMIGTVLFLRDGDEASVDMLRDTTRRWMEAILDANPEP